MNIADKIVKAAELRRLNAESVTAKLIVELTQARELIRAMTFKSDGKYFFKFQEDTDITDFIEPILKEK